MNYESGEHVELGDVVRIFRSAQGVVVILYDDHLYSRACPKAIWGVGTGVVTLSKQLGVLHHESTRGITFLGRESFQEIGDPTTTFVQ